jgi:hypothetical protein
MVLKSAPAGATPADAARPGPSTTAAPTYGSAADHVPNNLKGLPLAPAATRYVKKLGEQETEIETLRRNLAAKRAQEASFRRELDAYLLSLNVE